VPGMSNQCQVRYASLACEGREAHPHSSSSAQTYPLPGSVSGHCGFPLRCFLPPQMAMSVKWITTISGFLR